MSANQESTKEQFRRVLKALTPEEQKLFSEVLKAESARLNEKSPNMRDELLKIVRQVIR